MSSLFNQSENTYQPSRSKPLARRRFLQWMTAGSVAAVAFTPTAKADIATNFLPRELAFYNTHTGEEMSLTYFEQGQYLTEALQEIDNLFRDHRTGEVYQIDANLLNVLYKLKEVLEIDRPFHIISGYRSPSSNADLYARTDGVARHSFHMEGKAVDIRVEGLDTRILRDAAISLQQGGVGYYPSSNFVHVDTGLARYW